MSLVGVMRFQFQHLFLGQEVQWQTHAVHYGAGDYVEDTFGLLADLTGWWISYLQGNTLDACTLFQIKAIDLSPGSTITIDHTAGLPAAGTGGASDALTQLAMLVKHAPAISTRHSRNRMFIPGVGVVNLESTGLWSSGAVGATTTAFTELALMIEASETFHWCTVSPSTVEHWTSTLFSVSPNPSTLNRRRIGRGR